MCVQIFNFNQNLNRCKTRENTLGPLWSLSRRKNHYFIMSAYLSKNSSFFYKINYYFGKCTPFFFHIMWIPLHKMVLCSRLFLLAYWHLLVLKIQIHLYLVRCCFFITRRPQLKWKREILHILQNKKFDVHLYTLFSLLVTMWLRQWLSAFLFRYNRKQIQKIKVMGSRLCSW